MPVILVERSHCPCLIVAQRHTAPGPRNQHTLWRRMNRDRGGSNQPPAWLSPGEGFCVIDPHSLGLQVMAVPLSSSPPWSGALRSRAGASAFTSLWVLVRVWG